MVVRAAAVHPGGVGRADKKQRAGSGRRRRAAASVFARGLEKQRHDAGGGADKAGDTDGRALFWAQSMGFPYAGILREDAGFYACADGRL